MPILVSLLSRFWKELIVLGVVLAICAIAMKASYTAGWNSRDRDAVIELTKQRTADAEAYEALRVSGDMVSRMYEEAITRLAVIEPAIRTRYIKSVREKLVFRDSVCTLDDDDLRLFNGDATSAESSATSKPDDAVPSAPTGR